MSRPSYLIIHKTEWDRLKRGQSTVTKDSHKNDYLKSSIEQSQKWIKMWPDTVQGHVYQREKQKQIEHAQKIQSVKKFISEKEQEIKMESIKKARDAIFEDSCYGRQLLSALLESKTLEEREQQVLFQKYIKKTTDLQKQNDSTASSLQNACEMESIEVKTQLLKKQRDLDVARINQAMAKKQRDIMVKEKEKEKNEMIIDKLLEEQLLRGETNSKITKVNLEKQLINEYEAYRKQIKKLQTKKYEEDERKREIYRKHHDIVKNKEKYILNEIYNNKSNIVQFQHVYKTIKNLNGERNKKYDEFIEKGISRLKKNAQTLENEEIEQKTIERNKRQSLDSENKTLAELQYQIKLQDNSKFVCCRQSIIGRRNPKKNTDKTVPLHPSKKKVLLDCVKKREIEPTPWNALQTTHKQFAQHAGETLRQCRFKHMARRVINDYRNINCLDEKSLPVPDYETLMDVNK